jgi:uncharacterized protein involved in exopolysaccharide biosynthesis
MRALSESQELGLALPTRRDVVQPVFRYRRAAAWTFTLVLAATGAVALLLPRVYESEMKILVRRERLDPIMTSGERNASPLPSTDISEVELHTEVELLQSRDLLERVAAETGLHLLPAAPSTGSRPLSAAVSDAAALLRENLTVEPIRRTTFIAVRYRSPDPRHSAAVLERLGQRYLEKHLAVHRPQGAHDFFAMQAARLQRELHDSETRLRQFSEREGVVSAGEQKASVLQRVSEFELKLAETEAAIADATRRWSSIEEETSTTPDRQVTQVRNAANVDLVRGLRASILQVEMKRNEMLQKFTPEYPPVVRLGEELRELQAAVTEADRAPLRDETTDRNPAYQWLRNEAARVRTERDALLARATAIGESIAEHRSRAQRLDALQLQQQEMVRTAKAAEEEYLLYRRKQEETRISDALDQTRIANVTIADPPVVPLAPMASPRSLVLVLGVFLAIVSSFGVAWVMYALDPRFRTPDEVYEVLELPVLASLPAAGKDA